MSFHPRIYGYGTNLVVEKRVAYGRDHWKQVTAIAGSYDCSRPLNCTIQAVLEPNKVRVISKGEAIPYYSCRPLQKAIHGSMRDMDCFRLIGRPFSPTDLIDLKDRSEPSWKWFSVDYSAATDGLSWKYSGRILRHLISKLSVRQQEVAMAVLGPHNLHYPDRNGKEVTFKGVQRNGQLMGSILSFPILCLANLGVYLSVSREFQDGWSDVDRLRHVLVNGDDMVYAAPESYWARHIQTAAEVGLEMSVGKSYVHTTYVNINSTSIHYDLRDPKCTPWQIDYLNTGLFYGQHKVQAKLAGYQREMRDEIGDEVDVLLSDKAASHHEGPSGLVCNLNVVLQGCLPGRQSQILEKFLCEHTNEIKSECTGYARFAGKHGGRSAFTRNLFWPRCYGGMGVDYPPGFRFRATNLQIRVAQTLIKRSDAPYTSMHPIPGYELIKLEDELTVPWSKKNSDLDEDDSFLVVPKVENVCKVPIWHKDGCHPHQCNFEPNIHCRKICDYECNSWTPVKFHLEYQRAGAMMYRVPCIRYGYNRLSVTT
jgi:hypothetical protein